MRPIGTILASCAALALCSAALGEDKAVNGTVVDAKGQPVAGAEIAVGWKCGGKDRQLEPSQKIKTDRTGRFMGNVPCDEGPVAIMALAKDRKSGAVKVASLADLGKTIKLELAPLVKTAGKLELGDFAAPPKKIDLEIRVMPEDVSLIRYDSESTTVELALPVGSYKLMASAADAEPSGTEFDLDADEPEYDFGKVSIEPKAGKGADGGKEPFFKITDAIGVSKDMKLADYKGKWVLIDFWGYW